MHSDRNSPTPTPTVTSSTTLLMCGTVCASTCRSGSATVTAKPTAKLISSIFGRFFVRVSAVPSLLPICVMDASAPSENRPSPRIIISVPIRKLSIRSVGTGAIVRHSRATISTMGRIEPADSRTFSAMDVRFLNRVSPFRAVAAFHNYIWGISPILS